MINGNSYPYNKNSPHYTWLSNAIDGARDAGIRWIIVGMHNNCISIGTKDCVTSSELFNLLLDKKVDLVLHGHDHSYQRSKQLVLNPETCPIIWPGYFDSDCIVSDGGHDVYQKGLGTVDVIAGVGGKEPDEVNGSHKMAPLFVTWMGQNSNPTTGFVKITVSKTKLISQFIPNNKGGFTDMFMIDGTATPLPTPTEPYRKKSGREFISD